MTNIAGETIYSTGGASGMGLIAARSAFQKDGIQW